MERINRIHVEKKDGFDVEAQYLKGEFINTLNIKGIEKVRVILRYDFVLENQEQIGEIINLILSEPNVDNVYEQMEIDRSNIAFAIEYLPGQYDQRADSASQCIQIMTGDMNASVKTSKLIIIQGKLCSDEINKIKKYCINPVETREAQIDLNMQWEKEMETPHGVEVICGFNNFNNEELLYFVNNMGLAMSFNDIIMVQDYFSKVEKRNPTITELKVIDTYWSDHCRHTTFATNIKSISIEEGFYKELFQKTLSHYLDNRKKLNIKKPITLMDLATINTKSALKKGLLKNLDESEEINACSIEVEVDVDGEKQNWLLMFKNETHNHPTEIEPFGGAATCLGGAIRDPLSGRSYVYQAMRITGSADPREPVESTISGKLSQRKITKEAARGFSSYGNQIGLATGQVVEIYHEGYKAKRMEVGAVIGAVPKANVHRTSPQSGDVILLIGGKTGRDGIGGATGSSKAHTEESILKSGAEVQKGNPPEERKLQRLFRNPEFSKKIKKCNDFGAGGVSVAIGELASGLLIDLDKVPKKYEGLDGTELAISESQERMAVVVQPEDAQNIIKLSQQENLQATSVAVVTDNDRLIMKWHGEVILNIRRDFLDSNGADQFAEVLIKNPEEKPLNNVNYSSYRELFMETLADLNVCSQKGLAEMFDSTIGSGSVVMPYGGKFAVTPSEGMSAKIPVLNGETDTCSIMSYGCNPSISYWSPYHGGVYAVVESVSKIVAMGGDYSSIRLSLQEYFEKLGSNPQKWGKPFSALMGAYYAQEQLGLAAIGGKDSMSGSFGELNVPPTIISFAVAVDKVNNIMTPEFKRVGSPVYLIKIPKDKRDMPDFEEIKSAYIKVKQMVELGKINSIKTIGGDGIASAVSKMCFGNKIGFSFNKRYDFSELIAYDIGSLIIEGNEQLDQYLDGLKYENLGVTITDQVVKIAQEIIPINELLSCWESPLEKVFPIKKDLAGEIKTLSFNTTPIGHASDKIGKPRVFIPVFPGTNCEYDSERAFTKAGAQVDVFVIKNLSKSNIEQSIEEMVKHIKKSQILMIPGGFSAGDEPDGSGKFIATLFRNPYVTEATMDLIKNRDGLILGICNGFQALIKLGLVPYGEIRETESQSPTLTYNTIGRHVSRLVNTRVTSNLSPWFSNCRVGDVHKIPVSHGEGRFIAGNDIMQDLINSGQISTQYVDDQGQASNDGEFNPNGSVFAVEGITSPDGRILGKMGHSERIGEDLYKNTEGENNQNIFKSGVEYFV